MKTLDKEFEKAQSSQVKGITDKVATLYSRLVEAAVSFNEEFHPYLLTVTAGRLWLLSRGLRLFLTKCLNSSKYRNSVRKGLSCAYVKGAQDGLAAGIEHGKDGRELTTLAAYRPSAQADYDSALAMF